MKALTLTDYISKKLKSNEQFAEHFAREQIINNIAEMIVEARENWIRNLNYKCLRATK
jgi:hypothetical protein